MAISQLSESRNFFAPLQLWHCRAKTLDCALMLIDYHMHTELTDGTGRPVDYARVAVERGLDETGCSEHARTASRWITCRGVRAGCGSGRRCTPGISFSAVSITSASFPSIAARRTGRRKTWKHAGASI